MNQAQPGIVTEEQLARLVNVFLPDSDLSPHSSSAEAMRASSQIDINWRLYFRMVKLHPEHLALIKELSSSGINYDEFRRRKKLLFYKLMGEYNAAILILRQGWPLDLRLFYQTFTADTSRMTFFSSFCAGQLKHDAYVSADHDRIVELVDTYYERLSGAITAGDHITDVTSKVT